MIALKGNSTIILLIMITQYQTQGGREREIEHKLEFSKIRNGEKMINGRYDIPVSMIIWQV